MARRVDGGEGLRVDYASARQQSAMRVAKDNRFGMINHNGTSASPGCAGTPSRSRCGCLRSGTFCNFTCR